MTLYVRASLIVLLLLGCSDAPVPPPEPQPFAVEHNDVWSGTSISVSSAGFVGADPAAVLLDDDTLTFTRLNDSTLLVAMPDVPETISCASRRRRCSRRRFRSISTVISMRNSDRFSVAERCAEHI